MEASVGLLVCVGTSGEGAGSEGRAPGMSITSSLVSFRVAPEAEPMIRRHHQREDRRRGRNEGKGRGGWRTWSWISSYLDWPLSRIRNLTADLLDIQFETSWERTLTRSQFRA